MKTLNTTIRTLGLLIVMLISFSNCSAQNIDGTWYSTSGSTMFVYYDSFNGTIDVTNITSGVYYECKKTSGNSYYSPTVGISLTVYSNSISAYANGSTNNWYRQKPSTGYNNGYNSYPSSRSITTTNNWQSNSAPSNNNQTNYKPINSAPSNNNQTNYKPTNSAPSNNSQTNYKPTNSAPSNNNQTNYKPTNSAPSNNSPNNYKPTNNNTKPANAYPNSNSKTNTTSPTKVVTTSPRYSK